MPIAPELYAATSAYNLLVAAARGHVPFDHRLLHRLLDNPAETLPDIVRFAKEERSEDRVDLSVDLMRIFAVQPSAEAVPFLMTEFRRYPEEVPDEMTEVLARIGAGALDGLLELWEDGVAMEEVAFHLATLGVRDQRVVDVIEEVRKDDKEEASYLQQIYDEYAGQQPDPYDIYAEYPETDIPDLDLLPGIEREQFLDSSCAEHRRIALDHLIGQDLSAALVTRVLRMAQSDPDTEVRGLAWEALRDSTDQENIRDSMMARIDSPNTPALERASLCIGLAYNLDDETVRPHLDAAYNDPATRAKAVEAMARSFDRGFAPMMVKHLEDPDPDIAQAALWGVGYLRVNSEAPKLEKMFEDPDRRTEALYCYALAAPAEDSKLGLKQLEQRMEKLANGLAEEEAELIHHAFDLRFELVGKKTSFSGAHSHGEAAPAQTAKVGRNDACPCGSGKKYKKCCGA